VLSPLHEGDVPAIPDLNTHPLIGNRFILRAIPLRMSHTDRLALVKHGGNLSTVVSAVSHVYTVRPLGQTGNCRAQHCGAQHEGVKRVNVS